MGRARQQNMAVALVACLALLFRVSSAAVSHTVGDATGWTQPSSPNFYNTWASNQPPFNVGDFLVFNFPGASQTVAEVTKSAYDSCSAAAPITQVNNGPVNLTITAPGPHYYISTDSGHCSAGQKFTIIVASPKAPPPTGTAIKTPTAPSPKSSTPSTPSGAMTPAASAPSATPTGKGSMAPSTKPFTGAMTPATSPAGKGSTAPSTAPTTPSPGATSPAASPTATPVAAPASPSMSPAIAPTGSASSSEPGTPTGAPMASGMTPSAGGPSASAAPSPSAGGENNSASAVGASLLLPLLLLVGCNLLFK